MALNPSAVRVAGTGEIFVAPEGTTEPADATTALPAAWKGLGLTTTDGVEFSMSRDTTDIDAWQQSKVRVVSNAEPITLKATLMETRQDTLMTAFGGGTYSDTGTAPNKVGKFVPPKEGTNTIKSLVVEYSDGDMKYRYYFPRVQVEGDIAFTLTRSDAVSYEITWGVLAPPTGKDKWTLFTNNAGVLPLDSGAATQSGGTGGGTGGGTP
jgi:hypothetical protein